MAIDHFYHRFDRVTVTFVCPYCKQLNRRYVATDFLPEDGSKIKVNCESCESSWEALYKGGEVLAVEEEIENENSSSSPQ